MSKLESKDHALYILLMFFVGSFIGFIWEVVVYWVQHTESFFQVILELRGFLYGPWVPIYGIGIILIYLLTIKLKHQLFVTFVVSACLCSLIEYVASWGLDILFHLKLWDYSHQFLNINGRICLLSALFFGVGGILIINLIEPFYQNIYKCFPRYIHLTFGILFTCLFAFDLIISLMIKYK